MTNGAVMVQCSDFLGAQLLETYDVFMFPKIGPQSSDPLG